LIALTVALIAFAVGASLKDAGAKQAPVSLALLLASAAGWIGALMARDLVAMIAAVEAAWLACVGLVLVNAVRDREPLNGALRMLSIGGVGAALMLVGAAMLGRGAGSFELDALPLASIRMTDLAGAGAALMILGLAVKAGVAPLHAWSAAAIGRANAMVTLGVGVLGVVGALCVLARFSAYVITSPYIGAAISGALAALGGLSVVIGAVQAVGARNLLRLAAYAGVSQAGCVLLSVALGSPAGFAAAFDPACRARGGGDCVLWRRGGGTCADAGDARWLWPACAACERGDHGGCAELDGRAADDRLSWALAFGRSGCRRGLVVGRGAGDHRVARRRVLWRALDRAHVFPAREHGVCR
jgi:NADH:ubiquinone oxidoreductase subunit 2 (subunit N)